MAIFVASLIILITLLLPFLDKIIQYFSPKGTDIVIEEEADVVMTEVDSAVFHPRLE